MPYNTRRKSLSLPSLGIHLPSASRRSPSISKPPHATDDQMPPSKKVKKSHDSSSLSPEPLSVVSPADDAKDQLSALRPAARGGTLEHTPPPSPVDGVAPKIDTEGINDDIVVAVIEQLEKTGNRPHLVKELAAVLVALNGHVTNSANPAALLSSRLSTYMKRPWTALAPCPLAKELVPIHPRKVYYYLTTFPRQPLPETLDDNVAAGVDGTYITPSVSSVDQDEEDALARDRSRLSPSPEVDLSSPDFEDDLDLHGRDDPSRISSRAPGFADHHDRSHLMHSNRAASPPLEGDEREFTQTASAVRERASEQKADHHEKRDQVFSALTEGLSELEDASMSISPSPLDDGSPSSTSGDHMLNDQNGDYFSHLNSQEQPQSLDEAAAATLFGTSPSPSLTSVASSLSSGTSAALEAGLRAEESTDAFADAPQISLPEDPEENSVSTLKRSIDVLNSGLPDVDMKMPDLDEPDDSLSLPAKPPIDTDAEATFDAWKELQSPETVEVDELDEMFADT
ncbi:hypothetical protein PHISP_03392 [Aspergillus sp. HF37]|nr:hypothetical protein PHISP_03392 [Aspergillus sp. HF37]